MFRRYISPDDKKWCPWTDKVQDFVFDAEVPVSHADRLAELARDGRPTSVSVVTVDDVNHLLLPAVTGDVSEYPSLADRDISVDVTTAINDWLTETFSAIR